MFLLAQLVNAPYIKESSAIHIATAEKIHIPRFRGEIYGTAIIHTALTSVVRGDAKRNRFVESM